MLEPFGPGVNDYVMPLSDPENEGSPPLYAVLLPDDGSLTVRLYTHRPTVANDNSWVADLYVEHYNNQAQVVIYDVAAALRNDEPAQIVPLIGDVRALLAREVKPELKFLDEPEEGTDAES